MQLGWSFGVRRKAMSLPAVSPECGGTNGLVAASLSGSDRHRAEAAVISPAGANYSVERG